MLCLLITPPPRSGIGVSFAMFQYEGSRDSYAANSIGLSIQSRKHGVRGAKIAVLITGNGSFIGTM